MAKGMYAVVGGSTKKIKTAYCVVGGVTKKLKAVYAVVGGVTKPVWTAGGKKRFIYQYQRHYPSYAYGKTSTDFVNWTNWAQIGDYDATGTYFGNSSACSYFYNDNYYFISHSDFAYTSDGVTYTEYNSNFNPVQSFDSRDIKIADNKFYAVYYHTLSSGYKGFSIYTSTNLIDWTLLTSFYKMPVLYTENSYNSVSSYIKRFQFFKGNFKTYKYAIFAHAQQDGYDEDDIAMFSNDGITWFYDRMSSGSGISYSFQSAFIADGDIYYYTRSDPTSSTSWNLSGPNGFISISGSDWPYYRFYGGNFWGSTVDKNYIMVSDLGSNYTSNPGIWKFPKTGGTATKISTVSISGNDATENQRRNGLSTRLTKGSYSINSWNGNATLTVGYSDDDGVTWTERTDEVATSDNTIFYSRLIYD